MLGLHALSAVYLWFRRENTSADTSAELQSWLQAQLLAISLDLFRPPSF